MPLQTGIANQEPSETPNEDHAAWRQAEFRASEAVFQAAQAILRAAEITEICQELSLQAKHILQASRVEVLLVEHEHKRVLLEVVDGLLHHQGGVTYEEITQGLRGTVCSSGQPILSHPTQDGMQPPETAERPQQTETGTLIVAPLTVRGKVTGTIEALRNPKRQPFNQADVEVVMFLAMQAAVAIETIRIQQAEEDRRRVAEALVEAGHKLSGSLKPQEVPGRILEQLALVVPYERGSLMLREDNSLRIAAQRGFPEDSRTRDLRIPLRQGDVFYQIASAGRPVLVDDVTKTPGWQQVDWLPLDLSWMGVPLFSRDQVIGMVSLTRKEARAFSPDDSIMASTFALQAATALENATLYDEITRFNEQLEQMVAQRTQELNQALHDLERMDRNKSDFINVAAHELRTPLTVMKGYLGIVQSDKVIQNNAPLFQALDGVLKGTERLYEIVNSMLDVVRIDSQVLDLRLDSTSIAVICKRVLADYEEDLHERQQKIQARDLNKLPQVWGDSTLLLKVFQNVISNAIKYTPDGGTITVSGKKVVDEQLGECVEITVQDTGIGIDPEHKELIFEKFYQTSKSDLHSTGKTKFKGGGPGLGLAIARGIVQAHGGRIWVESAGHDEQSCPGSCFHILLPISRPVS
jgi:signal transduction histidine kinase